MANNMLKFRRGTYAQINAAPLENGTIYIATNEKAMYVDTATERIRIGDFIRVDTVDKITPPYSTSSLYYVEKDNALLKYDGTNWKQVNGTDDIKTELAAVKGDVATLKSTVGSATSGLVKDMADAKTAIANNTSAIGAASVKDGEGNVTTEATGLHALIEANADDIDAAELRIKALEDTVGTNEEGETIGGRVTVLEGTVAGHTGKISALETASAQHVTKTEAEAFAKTADIQDKLDKVDTETGVKAAIEAAVAGEKTRAEAAEKTLTDNLAGVKATADGALQVEDFTKWQTSTNDVAIENAKLAAIEAAEDYADNKIAEEIIRADGKYATQNALTTVDNKVSGNAAAIKTINETLATKATKDYVDSTFVTKANADAKLAKIDTEKNISEAISDAVAAEAARADKAEKANASAISKLQGDLANVKSTADAAVTDAKLDEAIKNFATTSYVDKAEADAVAKAKEDGDKAYAAKSIEQTVAGHTSALVILNGEATVSGSVAEAKKAGTDAQSTIDSYVTTHKDDYTNAKINEIVADAKKAGTDAAASASANAQAIATLQGTVNKLDGDVNTTGSVKKQIKDATDALETSLTDKIEDKINAANAMEYQKGINSKTALNEIDTSKAKVGDTYVITAAFDNYKPGDLLIATGTETDGVITSNFSWTHVKTGYDASLEQKLTTVDGKVQLSSIAGANNGQITFVSDGSAAKVSVAPVSDTNNNPVVTIGMVWADF